MEGVYTQGFPPEFNERVAFVERQVHVGVPLHSLEQQLDLCDILGIVTPEIPFLYFDIRFLNTHHTLE